MKLEREAPGDRSTPLGALFGVVLIAGAGLAALWLRLGLPRPVCHLREWIGLPCPTCGSTRLVEAVLAGDLLGALALNPLVFLGLTGVAAWAVASAVRWRLGLARWRVVLAPGEQLALRGAAVAAIAAGWGYLIVRGI